MVCQWPPDSPHHRADQSNSQSPTSSTTAESSHAAAALQLPAPLPQLAELCKAASVKRALQKTPKIKPEDVPSMLIAFENVVLCTPDPSNGVSIMCMPLAVSHPPLLHALLGCAGLPASDHDPSLQPSLLVHYNLAVTGLLAKLQRDGPRSEEWMQATILLLHIFEEHQTSDNVLATRQSHIRGAHLLFRDTVLHRPPTTLHQINLLSAYIYRTSVNCLCDASYGLPYDHLDTALAVLTHASSHLGEPLEVCPWTGLLGFPLCDYMYKLSWMINAYTDPSHPSAQAFHSTVPPTEALVMWHWTPGAPVPDAVQTLRHAHVYATRFLAALWTRSEHGDVVLRGIEAMEDMLSRPGDPMIAWPLTVLGCGCDVGIRQRYMTLVENVRHVLGPGTTSRMMMMLNRAWSDGPRILLDQSVMQAMFF